MFVFWPVELHQNNLITGKAGQKAGGGGAIYVRNANRDFGRRVRRNGAEEEEGERVGDRDQRKEGECVRIADIQLTNVFYDCSSPSTTCNTQHTPLQQRDVIGVGVQAATAGL